MKKICKWCDHIRLNDKGKTYCFLTKKEVIDESVETCKDYELMDYAF